MTYFKNNQNREKLHQITELHIAAEKMAVPPCMELRLLRSNWDIPTNMAKELRRMMPLQWSSLYSSIQKAILLKNNLFCRFL